MKELLDYLIKIRAEQLDHGTYGDAQIISEITALLNKHGRE